MGSVPPSLPVDGSPTGIELLFLGTGTSSSIPYIDCLTAPSNRKPCKTCLSTLTLDGKRNIRRNTSVALRVTGRDQKTTTIVIDVGKTFQAAAAEWFPKYGLRQIDAVLLTHAHADAMNGLDDLRGWTLRSAIQECIDVYVSSDTFQEVKRAFPYLVSKAFASGSGDVPDFNWHIIEDKIPFEIKDTGVWVTPFLVQHGRLFTGNTLSTFAPSPMTTQLATPVISGRSSPKDTECSVPEVHPYWCFGFMIQHSIVYMSDVSHIPEDVWPIIESGEQKSVLVVDCLRLRAHMSHMGVREAAATIRRLEAERNYLIGFNHELPHDEWVTVGKAAGHEPLETTDMAPLVCKGVRMISEGKIQEKGHWVRPSHDGLRVFVSSTGFVRDETYDES